MKKIDSLVFASLMLFTPLLFAKEFPIQVRVYAGATETNPQNLNLEMRAQGLKEFNSVSKIGLEFGVPINDYLDLGINYSKRYYLRDEVNSDPNTDYKANLSQDMFMLLGRVPVYASELFRVDVFAGLGGSNTKMTLKTASQDGELSRKVAGNSYGTLMTAFGASAAIGYKKFFLYFEAGSEAHKVDGFSRSGNINNNIDTIDFSGHYLNIGLLFTGIPASSNR